MKNPSMPSPGLSKPKTVVAISIKPKGPGGPSGGNPGMDPAGSGAGQGSVSPEKAIVVRGDEHCKDCENYQPESGACSEVSGYFDPEDACVKYFKPLGNGEPDADDQGGPPDNDQDDMSGPAMAS